VLADVDAEAHLARARMALRNAVAVVAHSGADGLAAAAIALRAREERASAVVLGVDPYGPDADVPDGPLAILDWGIRALGRPALVVDHAMPEVAPRDDQVFVSGYGEIPVVPSAALMRRIVREAPLWLAEIGIAADIGADHVSHDARHLAMLVDAPRRVPGGPVPEALQVLAAHDDPVEALSDPRIPALDEARREWKRALERVMRIEPEHHPDVSVVRFSSPYVLEDVVARAWALRLPAHQVLAVRDGVHVAGPARLAPERLAALLSAA
jgi:single-stranded-DNA-specific exonuclease